MKSKLFLLLLSCMFFAGKADAQIFTQYDLMPGSQGSKPWMLMPYNNKLLVGYTDTGYYRGMMLSDGTLNGTVSLGKTIAWFSVPYWFTPYYSKVLFSAADNVTGTELWTTDGTTTGTHEVKDINPGYTGSNPANYTLYNGQLYFSAADTGFNTELWATDGSATGTIMVKDIFPGRQYSGYPARNGMIVFNSKLFFDAFDTTHGQELWISDGTGVGTQLFKDINPGKQTGNPANFKIFNNKLYFTANDGVYGNEVWSSDGTPAGTKMLKDIFYSSGSGVNLSNTTFPFSWAEYNSKLYFVADSGDNINGDDGMELYVTDGTAAGTHMVKDINDGAWSSDPVNFINYGGKLYFSAMDGVHGRELWVTDGTAGGTELVKDINPGIDDSRPANFKIYHNKLYFAAKDATLGWNMFVTDGTESGTVMQAPPHNPVTTPSVFPLDPNIFKGFTEYNDMLYFTAYYRIEAGAELWSFSDAADTVTSVGDQNIGYNTLVYPNPASINDVFNIQYHLARQTDMTVRLMNLYGQVIATLYKGNEEAGEHSLKFRASNYNLPAGMYIIELVSADGKSVQRISVY